MNILKNLKKINITGATETLTSEHNTLLHNIYLIQKAIDDKESWTEGFELMIGEEDNPVELSITNSYPSERNYLAGMVTLQDGAEIHNANAKFPYLYIKCSNSDYIDFHDNEVRNILFLHITNDGLGIKESQAYSITSFEPWNVFWFRYNTTILSFDEYSKFGIALIPDEEFRECSNLKSIDLKNIETVGHRAFYGCINLTNINYTTNIKSIGELSFYNAGIQSITLPSLTNLYNYSFARCSQLEYINDLGKITTIPHECFGYATNLKTVTLPRTLQEIGAYAFIQSTKLEEININDLPNLKTIISGAFLLCAYNGQLSSNSLQQLAGERCFQLSNVTNINLPNLKSICLGCFSNCKQLTSVENLGSITNIPQECFAECHKLENVVVPDSVTILSHYAFNNCSNLENIVIDFKNITNIGALCFSNCAKANLGNLESESLVTIDVHAFAGAQIDTLNVPNLENLFSNSFDTSTIKKILNLGKYSGFNRDGDPINAYQFGSCLSLTDVVLNQNQQHLSVGMFINCRLLTNVSYVPESIIRISAECFRGCSELNIELNFPNLQFLGESAFSSCRLKKIINLGKIEKIYANTFSGNTILTDVVLPETVTNVGHYAFYGCQKLEKVDFSSMGATLEVLCFDGCTKLNSILNCNNLISLGDGCFRGTSITEINSETISSIGRECFSSCGQLLNVYLPNITSIPIYAFNYTLITELKFNDKLTSVSRWAFERSTLKTLLINNTNVPSLDGSFSLVLLQSIYVPDSALNDYKTAANWSIYADIIKPISEYPVII